MKDKKQKVGEGLNRVLSESTPANSDEVLNKLTGSEKSISDRLWVIRERIRGMRSEVEDLSSLMDYHSGSCLSQVIDLLNQAESLTDETMSLTMGQAPSEFRILDTGDDWEVWNDPEGIGIRFKKSDGKTRSRLLYIQTAEAYDEGFDRDGFEKLIEFARERFPQEFDLIEPDSL